MARTAEPTAASPARADQSQFAITRWPNKNLTILIVISRQKGFVFNSNEVCVQMHSIVPFYGPILSDSEFKMYAYSLFCNNDSVSCLGE